MSEARLPDIARVRAFALRAPIAEPVRASFGMMRDRPAVLVAVESRDGLTGWGEVWCNFPNVGAEYRARLVTEVVGPLVIGQGAASPRSLTARIAQRLRILKLQ